MASIILSVDDTTDNALHELTRELNVTFDEIIDADVEEEEDVDADELDVDDVVSGHFEFTGKYEELLKLVDRYTDDHGKRAGIIACICDIHN